LLRNAVKSFLIVLLFCGSIYGEVTVKGKGTRDPFSRTTLDSITLGPDDLKKLSPQNFFDLLKGIPGFHYSSTGGFVEMRFRGLREGRHFLVLIDGVPLNDPTAPGSQALFSQIPLDLIENVIIDKGPQGVSDGANAVAAVIKITTLKSKNSFQIGGGSYNSSQTSIAINQSGFGLHFSKNQSDGISSQKNNLDKDGFFKRNYGLHYSSSFNSWKYDLSFRNDELNQHYDQTLNPEKNYTAQSRTRIYLLKIDKELFLDQMDLSLQIDLTKFERYYPLGWPGYTKFIGQNSNGKAQGKIYFSARHSGRWGLGHKKALFLNKNLSLNTTHLFYQHQFHHKKVHVIAGSRYVLSSDFSNHLSPHLEINYFLKPSWRSRFKYSKTYTLPSLDQISSQKETLEAEVIDQYLLGVEKRHKTFSLGSDLFYSQYHNKITCEWSSCLYYMDHNKRKVFGSEFFVSKILTPFFKVRGFYQYTRGLDESGKTVDLNYMARNHFGLTTDITKGPLFWRTSAHFFSHYKTNESLQDYGLVDVSLGYKTTKDISLHLNINNIFNQSYFQKENYFSKGRHFYFKARTFF